MNPIVLSTTMFLALEGTAHFNPVLAFGVAIGGLLVSVLYLLAERTPSEKPEVEAGQALTHQDSDRG